MLGRGKVAGLEILRELIECLASGTVAEQSGNSTGRVLGRKFRQCAKIRRGRSQITDCRSWPSCWNSCSNCCRLVGVALGVVGD